MPPEGLEEREPCPTPLLWQDIVLSFHQDRREGNVAFSGGHVTATQYGTGAPLVFLPGNQCTARLYALIAWLLKDDRQCWVLDHPQFSKRPAAASLIEATATAYSAVLKDLFGGSVNIYASDYAVPVALKMMLGQESVIHKAVLQSGWANRPLVQREKGLLRIGQLLPLKIRRVPLWTSSQVQNHRPWFPPYDETRFSFLLSESSQLSVRDVTSRLLAAAETDLTPELQRIKHEVLLLRAEGDSPLQVAQQDLLERELENQKSEWMHTTGNYPFLTHPHRLVKILRDFFEIPKTTPSVLPGSVQEANVPQTD